jgi:high-affinity Fe2+/Pb2+ permease
MNALSNTAAKLWRVIWTPVRLLMWLPVFIGRAVVGAVAGSVGGAAGIFAIALAMAITVPVVAFVLALVLALIPLIGAAVAIAAAFSLLAWPFWWLRRRTRRLHWEYRDDEPWEDGEAGRYS